MNWLNACCSSFPVSDVKLIWILCNTYGDRRSHRQASIWMNPLSPRSSPSKCNFVGAMSTDSVAETSEAATSSVVIDFFDGGVTPDDSPFRILVEDLGLDLDQRSRATYSSSSFLFVSTCPKVFPILQLCRPWPQNCVVSISLECAVWQFLPAASCSISETLMAGMPWARTCAPSFVASDALAPCT